MISLNGSVRSTDAGSFSITAEIISFMAGTNKVSPTLNGKLLFAIKEETLYEAINPLTFWQVLLAKTLFYRTLSLTLF